MKRGFFRRTVGFLGVMVLCVAALAGCGKKSDENSSSDDKGGGKYKVALVSVQSFGDNGPADDMKSAINRAADELGVEVTTYEALQADQYEEALRNFAQIDYDMVITAFPGMAKPLQTVAKDFPDIKFVHIYSSEDYGLDNVASVDFATWEANYVCGVAAALASDSNLIGHIVGSEDNTIVANYNALLKGAQSMNPEAAVERVNAGTFDDPAKGKEIALSIYGKGAKAIIGDAGKTTLGMIEAAKETQSFIVGDASDHSSLAPGNVLLDTKIGFGNMVYEQIERMVNDKFESGLSVANYANDGIGTFKNVSIEENMENKEETGRMEELWSKVEEVEGKIKDGSLTVEKDISK